MGQRGALAGHGARGLAACLLAALTAGETAAEPPDLRTPAPVIHLEDNLGEVDRLGWCIDTVGRGYGEDLHAHSCKPQGGDVQFALDPETGQIRSAAFDGKCMDLVRPGDGKVPLGLRDCDAAAAGQRFAHDPASLRISPAGAPETCLAAGAQSRSAGPFLSRDLILAPCDETAPARVRWVVRP